MFTSGTLKVYSASPDSPELDFVYSVGAISTIDQTPWEPGSFPGFPYTKTITINGGKLRWSDAVPLEISAGGLPIGTVNVSSVFYQFRLRLRCLFRDGFPGELLGKLTMTVRNTSTSASAVVYEYSYVQVAPLYDDSFFFTNWLIPVTFAGTNYEVSYRFLLKRTDGTVYADVTNFYMLQFDLDDGRRMVAYGGNPGQGNFDVTAVPFGLNDFFGMYVYFLF
jgi:hypothetical protein